jgi:hypothetical protein
VSFSRQDRHVRVRCLPGELGQFGRVEHLVIGADPNTDRNLDAVQVVGILGERHVHRVPVHHPGFAQSFSGVSETQRLGVAVDPPAGHGVGDEDLPRQGTGSGC